MYVFIGRAYIQLDSFDFKTLLHCLALVDIGPIYSPAFSSKRMTLYRSSRQNSFGKLLEIVQQLTRQILRVNMAQLLLYICIPKYIFIFLLTRARFCSQKEKNVPVE